MQISVERIDELNRKVTVQVPEATIREQVESRLKSLALQAKFDGFRPGKVPTTLIRKRFGQKVREEVLSELIESTFARAVREEKLRPAGLPQITAKSVDEGQGLEYEAAFEIFPDFVPMPVEALEVKRYVANLTEQDLDNMIERLREQRRTWRSVDRPAEMNDRVTVSFEGTVGDESFSEGKIENFPAVLGGTQLLPGFEQHLLGAQAESHHSFDVEFPADYHNAKWAGKGGHFELDLVEVAESVLPEVTAEFAQSLGIEDGDLDALRQDVRENMEREMRRALKSRTKTAVLDVLYERNPITLPKALVESELKGLLAPHLEAEKKEGKDADEAELRDRYQPLVKRRVALALILNKLIEVTQMKVDPKRVRETVEELARTYDQPEQVIHWYYSNRDHLREVENLVLEEQLVDWILGKAHVREEALSFQDLMPPADQST